MKGWGFTRSSWRCPLLFISVLVTEIQLRSVGGAKEPFKAPLQTESSHGADAP